MLPANITLSSLYFAETSSFNSECYSCSFVPLFIIRCFTWNMHETQMDSPVHKHFHKWICPVQIFMWTHKFSLFRSWLWFCCLLTLECFQEQNGETSRLYNSDTELHHGSKSLVSQTHLIGMFFSHHIIFERVHLVLYLFSYSPIFCSLSFSVFHNFISFNFLTVKECF